MATHRHPTPPHTRRGSRFFRSGELHLVLLALLAERPQHGYELMGALEAAFGPAYTPSPGSIYPALGALETEALIDGRAEGERKVFSVTELGREALAERLRMLADVEARTGARLTGGAIEPALGRLVARVRSVASRVDIGEVEKVLDEAGDRVEALVDTEGDR
jgi:DNA-binding PadR family transcriptional regulator